MPVVSFAIINLTVIARVGMHVYRIGIDITFLGYVSVIRLSAGYAHSRTCAKQIILPRNYDNVP